MFNPIHINISNFDEDYAVFDAFCEYVAYKNSQIRRYAQAKFTFVVMTQACRELKNILSVIKKSYPPKEVIFIYDYARHYYKKFL